MSNATQDKNSKIAARPHPMPAHKPMTVGEFREGQATIENNVRGWEYLALQANEAIAQINAEISWNKVDQTELKYVQQQLKTAQEYQNVLVEENNLEISKLKVLESDYQVDIQNEKVNQAEWQLRGEQYKTGIAYVEAAIQHDKLQGKVTERELLDRQIQQSLYDLELTISKTSQENVIEADYLDVTGLLAADTREAVDFSHDDPTKVYRTPNLPKAPVMAIANGE